MGSWRPLLAGGLIMAMARAGTVEAQAAGRLPQPRERGGMSLEETLVRRRSIRDFTNTPLSQADIGQLCWAAQGESGRGGLRTAPSAGALYPLELYVVTASGVLHYRPESHEVVLLRSGDLRRELQQAALGQEAVGEAPVVFVVAAVYQRTAVKYGEGRARRYGQLEAGHAAENLLLQAVALDLGAVPVGAFDDRRVQAVLGLPADHEPLYLIPVGHARE
jgi:SagB-type dehydrogenase family enzyme